MWQTSCCMRGKDAPRYRPNPTRLSSEAAVLLEQVRGENIPNYSLYRREGYRPIGGVSQYDPFILRRGKVLHVQGARNFVAEQIVEQLQDIYRRRGKDVDIRAEKGAVFMKKGKRQRDVSSIKYFTYHDAGITFYVKNAPVKVDLGTASVAAATGVVEPLVTIPVSYTLALA